MRYNCAFYLITENNLLRNVLAEHLRTHSSYNHIAWLLSLKLTSSGDMILGRVKITCRFCS